MELAQQLYEGVALGEQGSVGLITYMRTDSPRLAGEAIGEIRGWIERDARRRLRARGAAPRSRARSRRRTRTRRSARPRSARTPESVRAFLTEEQFKLYDLIWKRAVASQAASAEYLATTVEIEAGRLGLRATGRVLEFAGFQKLYGIDEDDEREVAAARARRGRPLTVARAIASESSGRGRARSARAERRCARRSTSPSRRRATPRPRW